MRGSPLLQVILMVAAFLVAGGSVYRLTRPAAGAGQTAEIPAVRSAVPESSKVAPLDLELIFAPPPADFQVKNLGQIIFAGAGPQARFTTQWITAIPPEGLDLVVEARWGAAVAASPAVAAGAPPAAARVTVRAADGRQVEKSFWAGANGALAEVLTIPGENLAPTR